MILMIIIIKIIITIIIIITAELVQVDSNVGAIVKSNF